MADLKDYSVFGNTQFEILTNEGFKDFKGIIIGKNKNKIILSFSGGKLICTPKHKVMLNKVDYKYARDIVIGDIVFNQLTITDISICENDDEVYEILDVKDVHKYFVNGVLSHQCLIIDEMAHIQDHIMNEFWLSVIPVISSSIGTKVFAVSTPNGTGNKFYEIYSQAERGELKQWCHERIDWWEVPGRDKKWKESMIELLAKEDKSFDQEFGNVFIESGQSAIDTELIEQYRKNSRKPLFLMEDGKYKIWEMPNTAHLYVVGVDVGEGIGQAASVAQVLDITDLTNITQVACYHNNAIDPFHFAEVLNKMTNQWGKPFLFIERNNCGGQVIDALKHVHFYHNVADYTPDNNVNPDRLGIFSSVACKYEGIMNMRYWVNSLRSVNINDIALIQEMETFVRYPNGTWKAKTGDYIHDDRVMSLVWALFALETKIAQKYYEITAYDTRGKPMKIEPVTIELPKYYRMDPMYEDPNCPLPTHVAVNPTTDDDGIDTLHSQGWRFPNEAWR